MSSQLTNLPEESSVSAGDWIYFVDIDDTTDSSDGSSKKVTYTNFLSSLAGVVTADGTVPLTADWDIGATFKIETEQIIARSSEGLKLYEDGGTGLFVKDGGNVCVNNTVGDVRFHMRESEVAGVTVAGNSIAVFEENDNTAISIVTPTTKAGSVLFHDEATAKGEIRYDHTTDRLMLIANSTTRIEADGTGIGFFDTDPVAQQSGLTQITFTAPGTPDYAFQDVTNSSPYGFTDAEELRTFISVVSAMQLALKAYGLIS